MDTREELARAIFLDRYPDSEDGWNVATTADKTLWYRKADALIPAVAHIRAEALREAAAEAPTEIAQMWLRARADREEQR